MEFTLLSNGTDSFKKAKDSIDTFQSLRTEFAYHYLKDAIIFLNHGTEILMKLILSTRNESLIFENLKDYIKAKEDLIRSKTKSSPKNGFGLNDTRSVFDVNENLKTITLTEAMLRIETLCDIDISKELKNSIEYINKLRNKLMHHSITLDGTGERRIVSTIKIIYDQILDFFEMHISGVTESIDRDRFEITEEEYVWQMEQMEQMRQFEYDRQMSRICADDVE
jgi:hypothetical protein